jgi:[ribosomal protein S18]-alanine N-acetyltransferase
MIREYVFEDIPYLEFLGKAINENYIFKINEYTKCLVYTNDNYIVGFAVYSMLYDRVEIIDIVVKKEFKRNHIGTNLLNSIMKEAKKSSIESVTLEVRISNNEAIEFYKAYGFRELTVRKNYYNNGENALLMIKIL